MTAKVAPPSPKPRESPAIQSDWLKAHLGHTIQARLLDGKLLVGQLAGFDTFTLAIVAKSGKELLVYKQSLAYLAQHMAVENDEESKRP